MQPGSAKTRWVDPVKNRPAKDSTMNVEGDFGKFAEMMKRIVVVPKVVHDEEVAQNGTDS